MVRLHVIAVAALIVLLVIAAPAQAATSDAGIHFSRMVIEPDGSDFHVTVYYNASFMTKVFSMLFGTGALKSTITGEMAAFENVTLDSMNTSEGVVKFTAANQSVYADGWYVYDGNAPLPSPVDQLEISGPGIDRPIVVTNATEVPDFFYQ